MVKTPVLFETFVRVEYARQVWEAIKAAQPKKLYFYSNKGRAEKEGEIDRNNEIRSWINEVDWDCELHTWFRDECVDVYTSLRSAVNWICNYEEAWIVLEDDVVPSLAFFSFCDQMIEYYRDNNRVWYVSGDNLFNLNPSGYDLIFTHYHWMYGWATWRDRWLSIDWKGPRIDEMIEQGIYRHFFKTKKQCVSREKDRMRAKNFIERTKCWDYFFGLACDQNNAVGVIPKEHLVTNIGVAGVHHEIMKKTFVNKECTFKDEQYVINKRPPFVFVDYEYDYLDWSSVRKEKGFCSRFRGKLLNLPFLKH